MGFIAKIKMIFKIKKLISDIREGLMDSKEAKPGIRTTEFWGKIIVQFFTILGSLKGIISGEVAALVIGSLEGVYAIARSIAKFKGISLPDVPKK